MGSCNAIFVQRRSAGVYWVWPGPTQVDHEPDPNARNFIGQFTDRGSALCAAHDADHGTSDGVVELHDLPAAPSTDEIVSAVNALAPNCDVHSVTTSREGDVRTLTLVVRVKLEEQSNG